jgi:hypothetical protein
MNIKEKKKFSGSCHCGSIKFEIRSEFQELTTCDCSICVRKNALMVKVHEDDFSLLQGKQSLSLYQFNTNAAKHYFCSNCGIYPFHIKRSALDSYGINVFCLESVDLEGIPIRATDGIGMS